MRPTMQYHSSVIAPPFVSIITAYYNAGSIFTETVRAIQRMTFTQWEWIIIDDGSTDSDSISRLADLSATDHRVRMFQQENAGPSIARNRAAREARGKYLFQIDVDDLIEPTFVETALWVLECQDQFAACGSYNVTFGGQQLLWKHGFHDNELTLTQENMMTHQVIIRRDAFLACGGYDESIIRGHEDWDLWLNLARAGYWGYTIPEFLTWYRNQPNSRRAETAGENHHAFHAWLRKKHDGLLQRFPTASWIPSTELPHDTVRVDIPFDNPLTKPDGSTRVLFLVPWLTVGGADKFNLDLIRSLSKDGYEFTIAATLKSDHPWLHQFSLLTPDIFCLNDFLHYADYPRFLDYLIESRQIDAILISNSELGYSLIPYFRARHPNLAILDYTHVEEERWKNGGYPGMSVRVGPLLDVSVTSTEHLKEWMIRRGGDANRIRVCHTNIDPSEWDPARYDQVVTRKRLGISDSTPIILFVGRVVSQKRPLLFAKIIKRLKEVESNFVSLVVGTGDELGALQRYVKTHGLERHVRFLGTLSNVKVRELMAAADILLLPSSYEGLALVLFESLAMQVVPVATDFGGHPELVTPECGYLISAESDNIDDYITALVKLIRDRGLRLSMAQAGRQRVRAHFALQQMADGMNEAISMARERAKSRRMDAVDPTVALHSAHLAVECLRLEELSNVLWWERMNAPSLDLVRRLRHRILPIGTARYEVYKEIRLALRRIRAGNRQPAGGLRPTRRPGQSEGRSQDRLQENKSAAASEDALTSMN
jgi:glycosyltransferase involved in cell wall biosynthesis